MSGLGEKGGNAPHFHGHRERLKAKFGKIGDEQFADYELLELVLFQVIPRADTKPLAKELLTRFGSFAGVIGADRDRLMEVRGIGEAVVHHFKVMHAAAKRIARDDVARPDTRVLDSWKSLIDYCKAAMAYEPVEQFRILFLNKRNHLIADEVQQRGTVDHTPVYPREVVKRALQLSATAIILVHNHPSGDPTPSNADIQMTRQIVDVAKPLGIVVHDHIIVGRGGHVSFKGLKLI